MRKGKCEEPANAASHPERGNSGGTLFSRHSAANGADQRRDACSSNAKAEE